MDKSSLAHTSWECQYHIVFIPKYRRKVMYGKVREDMREIIRTLCRYKKGRNCGRSGLYRPCAFMRQHPAKDERIGFCRIPKGEVGANDL